MTAKKWARHVANLALNQVEFRDKASRRHIQRSIQEAVLPVCEDYLDMERRLEKIVQTAAGTRQVYLSPSRHPQD